MRDGSPWVGGGKEWTARNGVEKGRRPERLGDNNGTRRGAHYGFGRTGRVRQENDAGGVTDARRTWTRKL